ncbi:hypothetical protein K432DRAFT_51412 [Lepidopterella palustris CBS 459.81]|uniref:Uncharacterized protein n=1 Tax=Lepidopterella palustris CBS 459.81 TaxID=1314670 RepID=A0A8E2EAB8_9PEZI|nr:hypothetical protein K432DRAFT_51412 [Lepidopterella palustris CBS 459.81]
MGISGVESGVASLRGPGKSRVKLSDLAVPFHWLNQQVSHQPPFELYRTHFRFHFILLFYFIFNFYLMFVIAIVIIFEVIILRNLSTSSS